MLEADTIERSLRGTGVVVAERPPRTCINLRGRAADPRFCSAVASVTDLRPPLAPGNSTSGLLARLLWLGPDEWLVVSETQTSTELVARLRQALRGVRSAVTDVGHGRVVFAVGGPNARDVLAKGCSIDLHPREFASGRCAQSVLARVPVLIHQRDADPTYELYVGRSFGDYVWAWLRLAAEEYL